VHSEVTCEDIISVFKVILMDKSLIAQAEQAANTLGKRSHPGELEVSSNGWDVARPTKKKLTSTPKINALPASRTAKLMTKGRRG
jgi:hypothetical protein